jgi:hypothetical protein
MPTKINLAFAGDFQIEKAINLLNLQFYDKIHTLKFR